MVFDLSRERNNSVNNSNLSKDDFDGNSFIKKTSLYEKESDYLKLPRISPVGWICPKNM